MKNKEVIFDVIIGEDFRSKRLFLVTSTDWYKPTPEGFIISECARQLDIPRKELRFKRVKFELEVKNVELLEREK